MFSIHAKLFDRRRHAEHWKAALEARFGLLARPSVGR
jgi:hypothetical protein